MTTQPQNPHEHEIPPPSANGRISEIVRSHYLSIEKWELDCCTREAIRHYQAWCEMGHYRKASISVIGRTCWYYRKFHKYGTPAEIMHELSREVKKKARGSEFR